MGYPKTSREDNERWKIRFHSTLDRWLDDIEVQSQGEEQVDLGLEDLEEKFSENILDAVEEHHQKNNSRHPPPSLKPSGALWPHHPLRSPSLSAGPTLPAHLPALACFELLPSSSQGLEDFLVKDEELPA
ncbi:interleukin-32 isoform X7 [Equus przewalskii]|uniref:Interleukin-32 isoform X7 n=1 Tax=Equus przewalskii TaxID=9798 RepID=A0ABM4K4H1_EQUPR